MHAEANNLKIEDNPNPILSIMIPPHETEVFRLTRFSKDKSYKFALYNKKKGKWPDEKYYTDTDSLKYLGYWVSSERWNSFGDGSGGAENFNDNGKINRIEYDYDGMTCFVEAR
jgi:hypothetical protein